MIQRIQSLVLVLSAVCSILLFNTAFFTWKSSVNTDEYSFNALTTIRTAGSTTDVIQQNWPLTFANAVIILLTIAVIFMFKNRKQQARFCHLILLLQLGLICLVLFQWDAVKTIAGEGYDWHTGAGAYLSLLPLIFALIARFYINKDEALVRSADRLR